MARALQLINGVPRMTLISGADAIYDETFVTTETLFPASVVTLPNSGTYEGADLEVYRNGQFLEPDVDYTYEGAGPQYSQITLATTTPAGVRLRFRIEGDPDTIYDETIAIGVGGISTGTPITLPTSKTYTGDELEVFLGGQFLEPGVDYTYSGTGPEYTQIAITFDLLETERLRFRIDKV